MEHEEIVGLLKTAEKRTHMTTVYKIVDGPIVDGYSCRIKAEELVIESYDDGHQRAEVRGRTVTKSGAFKSSYRTGALIEVDKQFMAALADL